VGAWTAAGGGASCSHYTGGSLPAAAAQQPATQQAALIGLGLCGVVVPTGHSHHCSHWSGGLVDATCARHGLPGVVARIPPTLHSCRGRQPCTRRFWAVLAAHRANGRVHPCTVRSPAPPHDLTTAWCHMPLVDLRGCSALGGPWHAGTSRLPSSPHRQTHRTERCPRLSSPSWRATATQKTYPL
jgi:hypothetical protein